MNRAQQMCPSTRFRCQNIRYQKHKKDCSAVVIELLYGFVEEMSRKTFTSHWTVTKKLSDDRDLFVHCDDFWEICIDLHKQNFEISS